MVLADKTWRSEAMNCRRACGVNIPRIYLHYLCENCRRRLRSLLLCLSVVFRALTTFLVCWFCRRFDYSIVSIKNIKKYSPATAFPIQQVHNGTRRVVKDSWLTSKFQFYSRQEIRTCCFWCSSHIVQSAQGCWRPFLIVLTKNLCRQCTALAIQKPWYTSGSAEGLKQLLSVYTTN